MGLVFGELRRLLHPLREWQSELQFRRGVCPCARTSSDLVRGHFGKCSRPELIECPLASLSLCRALCRTPQLADSAARSGWRRLAAGRERPRFAHFRSAQIGVAAIDRPQRKYIAPIVETVNRKHLRDDAAALSPFDLYDRINGVANLAASGRIRKGNAGLQYAVG